MGSIPTRGDEIFTLLYYLLYFHFFALVSRLRAALSSATQHAMPPEFGRKLGTRCLDTRFPLPTLLCAEYGVTLILIYLLIQHMSCLSMCLSVSHSFYLETIGETKK